MTTAQELIEEIAKESPIVQDGEINLCKFCGKAWAESTFNDYLTYEEKLNSGARFDWWTSKRLRWERHDKDCVWVRINTILREEVK